MKLRDYGVMHVDVDTLRMNPHNPKVRTDPSKLVELEDSISKIGVFYPIYINENYEIIDGHRRYMSLVALGEMKVPVMFADEEDGIVFREINTNAKPMTISQFEEVYMSVFSSGTSKDYAMLPPSLTKRFEKVRNILGDELYKKIKTDYKVSPDITYSCASLAYNVLDGKYDMKELCLAIAQNRKASYVKNIHAAAHKSRKVKAAELLLELNLDRR